MRRKFTPRIGSISNAQNIIDLTADDNDDDIGDEPKRARVSNQSTNSVPVSKSTTTYQKAINYPVDMFTNYTADSYDIYFLIRTLYDADRLKENSSNTRNGFYLGEYKIEHLFKQKIDIITDTVSLYETRSRKENYFLVIISKYGTKLEIENLEPKEIYQSLFKLINAKRLDVRLKTLDQDENLFTKLILEVYLNEDSRANFINDDPSEVIRNNFAYQMHMVMTHLYFSHKNDLVKVVSTNDEHIDDEAYYHVNESKNDKVNEKHENLFDLVYDIHKSQYGFKNFDYEDLCGIQERSCLKPELRPYQISAVKWMLNKENFKFNVKLENDCFYVNGEEDELHPLFVKVVNSKLETIYYHKYLGIFRKEKPLKKKSLPGGILADEMGLGKTLEILACILINRRGIQPEFNFEPTETFKKSIKETFSCSCGKAPSKFGHDEGTKKANFDMNEIYKCIWCNVWTHIKCVNYNGPREEFLCLYCCTKIKPIKSSCTLIVTPSVISHQWIDEINKHVKMEIQDKAKNLKVFVYKGTQNGFVQPRDLSKLDICITTYDVLSNELSHVFAIENMRVLRRPKRFMNIPSPLIYVEWWRICLDEAQMVHTSNSKCADMANRLKAVNRWCITGTPIGRSLADLHGLFAFIREDPYCEKKWFKEELFDPYKSGDKQKLALQVSKVLWRTAKKYVQDQINIPKQTEKIYWLSFSPFESHLYKRVLEIFRENRHNLFVKDRRFDNYIAVDHLSRNERAIENVVHKYFYMSDQSLRLDELDRHTLSQLLTPILDLRITCNHPQLILRKSSFMGQNNTSKKERLLSMEKSLELLIKKTKTECEEYFRLIAMNANALAGLEIIRNNYDNASEIYQKLLDSANDNLKYDIRLDPLQQMHTCANYIDVLKLKQTVNHEANEEIKLNELKIMLKECEQKYIFKHSEIKMKSELKMVAKLDELHDSLNKTHDTYLEAFLSIVDNAEKSKEPKELWNRLRNEFSSYDVLALNLVDDSALVDLTIFNKPVKTFSELKYVIVDEFNKLIKSRDDLLNHLVIFLNEKTKPKSKFNVKWHGITNEMIQKTGECHLRKELFGIRTNNTNVPKCDLCKSDEKFEKYAKYLFANSSQALKQLMEMNEDVDEEDADEFQKEYKNRILNHNKNQTEFEQIIKIIYSFSKANSVLADETELVKEFIKVHTSLKDELKHFRGYWTHVSHEINAYDELEMGKIRMTLLESDEPMQNKPNYFILRSEIDENLAKHKNGKATNEMDLKKKISQLIYLNNLKKTNSINEGEENEDPCPICQCNLGFEWYLLTCGHSYCTDCYSSLLKNKNEPEYLYEQSLRKNKVQCALCRELVGHNECILVSTSSKQKETEYHKAENKPTNSGNEDYAYSELDGIKIKGDCNSAKVEGVVKCLVKILKHNSSAKCLVFSEHNTILELIISLLKDNFISHKYIKDTITLNKGIQEFKTDAINVLLMPYSFGANGLNIIEATHVLLVEPTLNKAQEFQAIGRVHRIGQTKPTFVYRFMIRNTIEELVYKLFKNNSSYSELSATKTTSLDSNQPNCSKAFEDVEMKEEPEVKNEESALTIADIHKLFENL